MAHQRTTALKARNQRRHDSVENIMALDRISTPSPESCWSEPNPLHDQLLNRWTAITPLRMGSIVANPLDRISSASSMHFQVRIFSELVDTDQPAGPEAKPFKRLPLLSSTITTSRPQGSNQLSHLCGTGTPPK